MTILAMAKPGGIIVYWDTEAKCFVSGPNSKAISEQGGTPGEALAQYYGTETATEWTDESGLMQYLQDYIDPMGWFHQTGPLTGPLRDAVFEQIGNVINPLGLGTNDTTGEPELNWWTPWLTGEAIVAGALIAGPTILDITAALMEGGKNGKKNAKMASGIRTAADRMRHSAENAMPAIASLLMNPAFALPFVYINLEALHKQNLIDSAIAHTIEPVMISAVMIEAIGKAVGPLAGALMKV